MVAVPRGTKWQFFGVALVMALFFQHIVMTGMVRVSAHSVGSFANDIADHVGTVS